ncbi:MAG: oligosaccharide flippase family protein [Flavobacterium sp.]|nr:oligosaccharide flippase family protein [Flavobacterium sp.]
MHKIAKILSSQASQSAIYKALTGFFMFLSISVLVRFLGEIGYGVWVLVFGFFQWGLYFDFGISNVLKSKIPELISTQKEHLIEKYVSQSFFLTLIISLLFLSIATVFIYTNNLSSFFNINLEDHFLKSIFILNAIFFCINFLLSINKSLYIGTLNPKISEKGATLTQVIFFIALLLILTFFKNFSITHKLLWITIINGSSNLFINGYYLIAFLKDKKIKLFAFNRFERDITKQILQNGLKFMLIQLFMVVVFFSDPYFIAYYSGPKDVSIFDVLNKLYQLPLLIISSGLASFWPFFAQKFHENDKNWFFSTIKKFNKLFLIISLGILLFSFIIKCILNIWVGKEISDAVKITFITTMSIIVLTRIFINFYTNILNGANRLNSQLYVMGCTALIKIPITIYILKNDFGLDGIFIQLLIYLLVWSMIFKNQSISIIKKLKN